MISSAALAVVTSMMASFGNITFGADSEDVACIAGQVWWQGRGAGFARKMDIAKGAVDDALAAGSLEHSCHVVVAAQPDVNHTGPIALDSRADHDAWNDSVLAALAAINSAEGPTQASELPPLTAEAAQATLVAHGNLHAFWQDLPEIDPPPLSDREPEKAVEPACWVDHSREQLRFRRCLSR